MSDERCFLEAANDITQNGNISDFKIANKGILSKRFLIFLNLRHQNLSVGSKKRIYLRTYTQRTHFVSSLKFIDTSKLRLEPLPAYADSCTHAHVHTMRVDTPKKDKGQTDRTRQNADVTAPTFKKECGDNRVV